LPAGVVYQPISALDIVAAAAAAAEFRCPATAPDGLNYCRFNWGAAKPAKNTFWRVFGLGNTGPPASQSTIWAVQRTT
jgi:hypothetical protein